MQIHCPRDCAYLASSREHPPAAALRQQQRDAEVIVRMARDLNQRQSNLLFVLNSFLAGYSGSELQRVVDEDVVEAAGAIAATLETAARGVIYEHRPASVPAGRLAAELTKLLAEVGRPGGSAFERDAAAVVRRIEETARTMRAFEPANARAFLDLLERVVRQGDDETVRPAEEPPRLIVP